MGFQPCAGRAARPAGGGAFEIDLPAGAPPGSVDLVRLEPRRDRSLALRPDRLIERIRLPQDLLVRRQDGGGEIPVFPDLPRGEGHRADQGRSVGGFFIGHRQRSGFARPDVLDLRGAEKFPPLVPVFDLRREGPDGKIAAGNGEHREGPLSSGGCFLDAHFLDLNGTGGDPLFEFPLAHHASAFCHDLLLGSDSCCPSDCTTAGGALQPGNYEY